MSDSRIVYHSPSEWKINGEMLDGKCLRISVGVSRGSNGVAPIEMWISRVYYQNVMDGKLLTEQKGDVLYFIEKGSNAEEIYKLSS